MFQYLKVVVNHKAVDKNTRKDVQKEYSFKETSDEVFAYSQHPGS